MIQPLPTHKPAPAAGTASVDAEPLASGFPVVGIGCSAGGLEALKEFLAQVPVDSGLAFVVVQHLAPDHLSVLPELLGRLTDMPVAEASEGMAVQPDHVYVIPPNRDLYLRHGRLNLVAPEAPRGLRLPVDTLLRSLADDQREQAIGVILSGMGSDGTRGLAEIKDKGGLTLAQDPASAQADSMPGSAIRAGVVDIVDAPGALPARILEYLRRPALPTLAEPQVAAEILTALDTIVNLLRDRTGNDFSLYKVNSLYRRVERRMAVHQITTIDAYAEFLRDNAQEIDLLFKELLIGVTSFFRDPELWDHLQSVALPALLERYPEGRALRAWVAACSSGEEAYSLAIVFKEALAAAKFPARYTLQIYATDLDADAIATARGGRYPASVAADISAERLATHFVAEADGRWRVVKDIRDMVVFATQNVVSDPPFTKLDLLACRNLLIYFGAQLQKKMLPLFHYALAQDGLLVLGSAETIGSFGHLFTPLHLKARLYQRLDRPRQLGRLEVPRAAPPATGSFREEVALPERADRADALGPLTDQLVQQTWAPPAVLVNAEGDILYVSGRTGKYLEPAAGKTNMNVHAMAREGLREALVGVIPRALTDGEPILLNGLRVGTNGGTQIVDLVVQALDKPEPLRGRVIIVFKDVAQSPRRRRSPRGVAIEFQSALLLELDQARQALRSNHDAMQTTVEELKSSNEELQSTNEELQSTNEELTTSKEEMQSLNEELQTVNAELQSKVDDLTEVRNDMANLLNSTEIATVFLSAGMRLRRYTTSATRLFKFIPGDIGRPLSDVSTDLDYPQLEAEALDVLRTLQFKEAVAPTRDGRWFRVRTMPYCTSDNVIDGVVITFTDITAIKVLEGQLRARQPTADPPLDRGST